MCGRYRYFKLGSCALGLDRTQNYPYSITDILVEAAHDSIENKKTTSSLMNR